MKPWITIEAVVNAPVEKVWEYWNAPEHITKWAFAQNDWHAPWATNDLRVGGKLVIRMEAKDGSVGFDLEGTYTRVEEFKKIEYVMGDRHVRIEFLEEGSECKIVESFEAEDENSLEMQKAGWQSILNNFKRYAEQK